MLPIRIPRVLQGLESARGLALKRISYFVTQRSLASQAAVAKLESPQSDLDTHHATAVHQALSNPLWLRDSCRCSKCIDQSTTQKLFQTSDIPSGLQCHVLENKEDMLKVAWKNDINGYDDDHVSTYSTHELTYRMLQHRGGSLNKTLGPWERQHEVYWNKTYMEDNIRFVKFDDYQNSDETVFEVLHQLKKHGLVFFSDVPSREDAVDSIAKRIGHLRDTFYGRTWNVKSVPQAKNVAYTSKFLGFHMDLLYMNEPPGLQLLHCLENSCVGGESMFSDSFHAAERLAEKDTAAFELLQRHPQVFHYDNDGHHYQNSRPVIQSQIAADGRRIYAPVNWSPPFQGSFLPTDFPNAHVFQQYVAAAKKFSSLVEAPENIYEYRMKAGECVLFHNRRVLHARREFDTSSGNRWLKGGYIDEDVFLSRYRVLFKTLMDQGDALPAAFEKDVEAGPSTWEGRSALVLSVVGQ